MRRDGSFLASTQTSSSKFFSTESISKYDVKKKNVVVALSGGVDSSVVAASLRTSIVACVHMTNWNPHEEEGGAPAPTPASAKTTSLTNAAATSPATSSPSCSGASDYADAQAVARLLQLPLYHVQFQSQYYHEVFEPFLNEIRRGRMPNPDVSCNSRIKFGALKEHVCERFGKDAWLATGHYARLWHRHFDMSPPGCLLPTLREHAVLRQWLDMHPTTSVDNNSETWLLQAADASKDQSYFLAGCQSRHFQQVLFPLGDRFKKDVANDRSFPNGDLSDNDSKTVRQQALELGLPTARKRDSTGICAVGRSSSRNGFRALVRDYLPPSTSPVQFVDVDTQCVVGRSGDNDDGFDHACLYTVGQGARISGASTRYFVTNVSTEENVVHVCAGTHHPSLYADSIEFRMQWVCEGMEALVKLFQADCKQSNRLSLPSLRVTCRIRHLQPLMNARLVRSSNDGRYVLHLDRPTRAVTPGQMAVVYLGLVCLGGGPIERRGSTYLERNEPLPDRLYRSGHNDTSLLPAATVFAVAART